MSQSFLLWKGKGSNPQVNPSGQFVVVQQAEDVVLHSVLTTNSERARFHGAQNGGWLGERVVAFRKTGNGMVWQVDAEELGEPQQTGVQAPGTQVVYAPEGEVASWERNGKLWWNGQLLTQDSGKIVQLWSGGLVALLPGTVLESRWWTAPTAQPVMWKDQEELPPIPTAHVLQLRHEQLLECVTSYARVESELDSWLVAGEKNGKSWVYAVVEKAQ